MSQAEDTERFAKELWKELHQAITMVTTRMSVEDPAKTFSPSHVIGVLFMVGFDYADHFGIPPHNTIEALRAAVSELDMELRLKTGRFAPRPGS